MAKQLKFGDEARQSLLKGIDVVARAVVTTLGPKGRNIALDKKWGAPNIVHDGVSVAKEIDLPDPFQNMGAQIVKEAGAICVKTATINDPLDHTELAEKAKHVKLMKESAPGLLVKAAGGIRTLADLEMMVQAGADIIGTSSGVEIVNESKGVKGGKEKDGRIIE